MAIALECSGEEIPKGILWDARYFFSIIQPILDRVEAENLAASNDLFLFAVEILQELGFVAPEGHDPRSALPALRRYSSFVASLEQPRRLSDEEIHTAMELAEFFEAVLQIGSAERSHAGAADL